MYLHTSVEKDKNSRARNTCSLASSSLIWPTPPWLKTIDTNGRMYIIETLSKERCSLITRRRYNKRVTSSADGLVQVTLTGKWYSPPRGSCSKCGGNWEEPRARRVATPMKLLKLPRRFETNFAHEM